MLNRIQYAEKLYILKRKWANYVHHQLRNSSLNTRIILFKSST